MPLDRLVLTKKGEPQRNWIECKVSENKFLLEFQYFLCKKIETFNPYPKEKLHVTLYHFGWPKRNFRAVQKFNSKTTYEEFLQRYVGMLESVEEIINTPFHVRPKELSLFGSADHRVIALILEDNKVLSRAVKIVELVVEDFYATFEVPDNYFKEKRAFVPHISLGAVKLIYPKKFETFNHFPKEIKLLPTDIAYHKSKN